MKLYAIISFGMRPEDTCTSKRFRLFREELAAGNGWVGEHWARVEADTEQELARKFWQTIREVDGAQ